MWLNLQADYGLRLARASEWTRIEPRVRVLATGE
jgi:plasmid maintenance system antidote protein VapI